MRPCVCITTDTHGAPDPTTNLDLRNKTVITIQGGDGEVENSQAQVLQGCGLEAEEVLETEESGATHLTTDQSVGGRATTGEHPGSCTCSQDPLRCLDAGGGSQLADLCAPSESPNRELPPHHEDPGRSWHHVRDSGTRVCAHFWTLTDIWTCKSIHRSRETHRCAQKRQKHRDTQMHRQIQTHARKQALTHEDSHTPHRDTQSHRRMLRHSESYKPISQNYR